MKENLVILKGGGDLGSGCAARLHRAGFRLLITELPQPLVIRRSVAYASAVHQEHITVEGITAWLAQSDQDVLAAWDKGWIPVVVDPHAASVTRWRPAALVDAIMAKYNTSTRITDAPIVVALGPGFTAGHDCHAVVETKRGHTLGRVYYRGSAEANSGIPGRLGNQDALRVIRAPVAGSLRAARRIGDHVTAGQLVAYIDETPVHAPINGVVRGLLADGLPVSANLKIGDIDPRGIADYCFTISDKSWAVGGGVLEAILHLANDG